MMRAKRKEWWKERVWWVELALWIPGILVMLYFFMCIAVPLSYTIPWHL